MAYLLLGIAIGGLLGIGAGVFLGAILHSAGVAIQERQKQEKLQAFVLDAMKQHVAAPQPVQDQAEGTVQ